MEGKRLINLENIEVFVMRRLKSSHVLLLLLVAAILVPASAVLAENRQPQGENLLENPDFEGDFVAFDTIGDVKVGEGWEPWWAPPGTEAEQAEGYGRVPSYYFAESAEPGAVKSGSYSQEWHNTYGTHAAGILQFVDVPDNSKVRFSIWGRSFTCNTPEDGDTCEQDDEAWMGLQIAIDPKGGESFYDDSVVFTPAINSTANDWQEFVVEADVVGSTTITVYAMYYPDFPREQNKVWWDNASLFVVGDAEGDGESSGEGAAPAAPVEAAFVTPQAPQGDCSIVHSVESGQNLSSIAVAYYNQGYTDITVPKIKELNNLSSDIIYVGQKLTIIPAGGATDCSSSSAPAAAAEETDSEGESAAEEAPTATPMPTEVAETTGQICMSLFDDTNGNTLRDAGELLLSGGTLSLTPTGGAPLTYTTDGASEPHCFPDLTPGEYVAEAIVPVGYEMTTVSSWSVPVEAGANLDLTFGAFGTGEDVMAEGETEEDGGGDGGGILGGGIGRILIGLSGLLVLAIAGGLGAYFLVFRRSS